MVSFSAPKIPALAEARLVGALLVVAPPPKGRHKACPYRPHRVHIRRRLQPQGFASAQGFALGYRPAALQAAPGYYPSGL